MATQVFLRNREMNKRVQVLMGGLGTYSPLVCRRRSLAQKLERGDWGFGERLLIELVGTWGWREFSGPQVSRARNAVTVC